MPGGEPGGGGCSVHWHGVRFPEGNECGPAGSSHCQRTDRNFLEEMEAAIEKRVPEKFKDMNMKALKLGAAASAMIR